MPGSTSNPAATPAARALVRSRWDRVTDPVERAKQTEKARAARLKKQRERREAELITQRVAQLLEDSPDWTDERREEIAALLKGGDK